KLLGAVTALSASLGATFITSATTLADGATLQLQFLKSAPNADPTKAQLLCKIDVSPGDQRTLAATEGPVELRIVTSLAKQQRSVGAGQVTEIVVFSRVIEKVQWNTIKIHKQQND